MSRYLVFLSVLVLLVSACDAARRRAGSTSSTSVIRVVLDPPVASPDGKRVAFVEHLIRHGAPIGRVEIGSSSSNAKAVYTSRDSCCTGLAWASSRLVVFDDDYNVKTVDVTTGRVRRIAGFSNFVLSKNDRLVAGWADTGGHAPEVVGVVSITGSCCWVALKPNPNTNDSDASFSADGKRLTFFRQRFDPQVGSDRGRGRFESVRLSDTLPTSPGATRC
jgi:hypothetical protein